MRTYTTPFLIAVLIFSFCFITVCTADDSPGAAIAGTVSQDAVFVSVPADPVAIPVPVPPPGSTSAATAIAFAGSGFSKLEINPSYVHFLVKPGESNEQTVTIRNRDSRTVTIRPAIANLPFNEPYGIDSSWITVFPQQTDLAAGESVKLAIRIAVPADAERGSYNSVLAITDEEYPSSTSSSTNAYPSYIHTLSLSVDVATTPPILTDPQYITDQLESGREYRYAVGITNNGAIPVTISPGIKSDSYPVYSSAGILEPALNAECFTITAPQTIPAHGNATILLSVRIPEERSGSYNGYIDLGIDNPAMREGEGRVQMSFVVWKQPEAAFIKRFSMASSEDITVTLTATGQSYLPVRTGRLEELPEPSFEVALSGPGGSVPIRPVKRELKGTVSVGGETLIVSPYSAARSMGYGGYATQYIYTYTAQGRPGMYTLSVMPENTPSFDYSISYGTGAGSSSFSPLFSVKGP